MKKVLALLLFIIIFAIYLLDRLICVPLFWLNNYNLLNNNNNNKQIYYSTIRVVAVAIVGTLIKLVL